MNKMMMKKAPAAILIGAGAFAAASGVTKWLWNKAVVPAAHANPIDFMQAAGILALSKLLFGARGGGRYMGKAWKQRMKARWESMTPEEKGKFKSRMQGCMGRRWKADEEVAVG